MNYGTSRILLWGIHSKILKQFFFWWIENKFSKNSLNSIQGNSWRNYWKTLFKNKNYPWEILQGKIAEGKPGRIFGGILEEFFEEFGKLDQLFFWEISEFKFVIKQFIAKSPGGINEWFLSTWNPWRNQISTAEIHNQLAEIPRVVQVFINTCNIFWSCFWSNPWIITGLFFKTASVDRNFGIYWRYCRRNCL